MRAGRPVALRRALARPSPRGPVERSRGRRAVARFRCALARCERHSAPRASPICGAWRCVHLAAPAPWRQRARRGRALCVREAGTRDADSGPCAAAAPQLQPKPAATWCYTSSRCVGGDAECARAPTLLPARELPSHCHMARPRGQRVRAPPPACMTGAPPHPLARAGKTRRWSRGMMAARRPPNPSRRRHLTSSRSFAACSSASRLAARARPSGRCPRCDCT